MNDPQKDSITITESGGRVQRAVETFAARKYARMRLREALQHSAAWRSTRDECERDYQAAMSALGGNAKS